METAVAMEGCPLDVVDTADATVLHYAADGGNVDLVRELVVRGCDVNAVKANGCTPLHDAAGRGEHKQFMSYSNLVQQSQWVGIVALHFM